MKRKEREGKEESGEGTSGGKSPQKKRVRFSNENEITTIPKLIRKREKSEVGEMGEEEERAMVRDILGVAGAVEMNKQKEELEDFEKEAKEKSQKLFRDELEDERTDGTQIDEKEVVVELGKASDRFCFFCDFYCGFLWFFVTEMNSFLSPSKLISSHQIFSKTRRSSIGTLQYEERNGFWFICWRALC